MQRLAATLRCIFLIGLSCALSACATQGPAPEPANNTRTQVNVQQEQTIALLGATGMVGNYLLQEALNRGYRVRALARTPAKLDAFRDQITIVEGDALDPTVIEELLRGSDVVITAIGPVKADAEAGRFVSTRVSQSIVTHIQSDPTAQISQYIVVSGAGVKMPGDDRNLLGWWIRTLAQLGLRSTLQDKQAEYEILAESAIAWMLVRCPLIEPEPFVGNPNVSLLSPPAFRVRAGELAHFIMDQVQAGDYRRRGPFLGSH
jgi:NADPH:quinone reductase-like Zn-dependent oxidoreductase